MAALMKLRRLLSNKDGTLVEILIENGCVPILIDFLSAKNSDVRFNAACIISYISSGTPEQMEFIVQAKVLPALKELLISTNHDICNQVLLALGNIILAGFHDECFQLGIIEEIIKIDCPTSDLAFTLTTIAIWIFRNIIEYVEIDAGVVNTISTIAGLLGVESEDPLQHNEISMAILCAIGTFFSRGENACRCLLEKHMGILEVLTKLLKADTTDLLQILMPLVENLCYNYGFNILPESATEFLRSILPVIKNENIDVVILALRSLSAFTESQIKNLSMPRWINERYANLLNYHDNAKLSEAIFYGFGTIFNICYPKMKDIVAKNTVKKMDLFLTHCDHAIQEKALCFLSKAADDKQKICYIVSAELLPHIIKILDCQNYVLQTKAADLIKKIAGGTNDETKAVVAAHAIAPLIYLLNSECLDVQVASLGALANITGCTPTERDNCVKLNIVDSLINLWSKQKSPTLLQHFAWILDNIFRDPLPPADVIRKLLPSLLKLIEGFVTPNPDLLNVLVDSLSALVNITRKISEANEYIIDKGVSFW
uniref:Importin subunit alpha n=1 Tax=Panagrolaimus davidi TaxID=227884 RepID=A0A914R4J9_9BILA